MLTKGTVPSLATCSVAEEHPHPTTASTVLLDCIPSWNSWRALVPLHYRKDIQLFDHAPVVVWTIIWSSLKEGDIWGTQHNLWTFQLYTSNTISDTPQGPCWVWQNDSILCENDIIIVVMVSFRLHENCIYGFSHDGVEVIVVMVSSRLHENCNFLFVASDTMELKLRVTSQHLQNPAILSMLWCLRSEWQLLVTSHALYIVILTHYEFLHITIDY